jgi:hypothetical protein
MILSSHSLKLQPLGLRQPPTGVILSRTKPMAGNLLESYPPDIWRSRHRVCRVRSYSQRLDGACATTDKSSPGRLQAAPQTKIVEEGSLWSAALMELSLAAPGSLPSRPSSAPIRGCRGGAIGVAVDGRSQTGR